MPDVGALPRTGATAGGRMGKDQAAILLSGGPDMCRKAARTGTAPRRLSCNWDVNSPMPCSTKDSG
eukprot:6291790-Alexandrium_andersonii.AAC.1